MNQRVFSYYPYSTIHRIRKNTNIATILALEEHKVTFRAFELVIK